MKGSRKDVLGDFVPIWGRSRGARRTTSKGRSRIDVCTHKRLCKCPGESWIYGDFSINGLPTFSRISSEMALGLAFDKVEGIWISIGENASRSGSFTWKVRQGF
ncbi:hypothetical protein CEXT_588851 [Caerostris extrusa]|uniref:Uncharacterized protein n=1 Tax=Caerostris extrusa TaxID=172846 RepID=A0AAV4TM72_CAEEX|nr:hypothetical protein CEXT_588851 [Caerostris extrusa]